MHPTTLPAKSSAVRRYDPVMDDATIPDDLPVVTRQAVEQDDASRDQGNRAMNGAALAARPGQVAPADTGKLVEEEVELDVTVDPLETSAMAAPAGKQACNPADDEETWMEEWEDDGGAVETPSLYVAPSKQSRASHGPPRRIITDPALIPRLGQARPAAEAAGASPSVALAVSHLGAAEADLWSATTVTGKTMPKPPPRGSIAAPGIPQATGVPERIGSGRLEPARLGGRASWRAGSAGASPSLLPSKREFRWDTMLTTACITAACGIGCIWLLRAILA